MAYCISLFLDVWLNPAQLIAATDTVYKVLLSRLENVYMFEVGDEFVYMTLLPSILTL